MMIRKVSLKANVSCVNKESKQSKVYSACLNCVHYELVLNFLLRDIISTLQVVLNKKYT